MVDFVNIRKNLQISSDRVKSVEIHPREPWVLSALYSGSLTIHNYITQSLIKSIEASTLPIRAARFVDQQQQVVCGGDDCIIRVFNLNTLEKIKEIEAHTDYIRHIDINQTLPYAATTSDDMTIVIWDTKEWKKLCLCDAHVHYVMQTQWNPKDNFMFASASLDRSIKLWNVQTLSTKLQPNVTLSGHQRGVNCIAFSSSYDKPYLLSGSDDCTFKLWDYQTRTCLHTIQAHTKNITYVQFHPRLPYLLTASEDGAFKAWTVDTLKLEATINYNLGRCWAISCSTDNPYISIGYDEGTVVIEVGKQYPIANMIGNKIILAKGSEIHYINLNLLSDLSVYEDGDILHSSSQVLGSSDIVPSEISYHPNGRFISVSSNDEYIIYTAQTLRSKAYGKGTHLVWANDGRFAVCQVSRITIFNKFVEETSFIAPFHIEKLFGGVLLGVVATDFVCFYDWRTTRLIRKIDVCCDVVTWNLSGDLLLMTTESTGFVLKYDSDAVDAAIAANIPELTDGLANAFTPFFEVHDSLIQAIWIDDTIIYINKALELNINITSHSEKITTLDRKCLILKHVSQLNKLFLIDINSNIITYDLHISMLKYIQFIHAGDKVAADQVKPYIPKSMNPKIASVLHVQGFLDEALSLSEELEQQLEICLEKKDLSLAINYLENSIYKQEGRYLDYIERKYKVVGDCCIDAGEIEMAIQCYKEAKDVESLLLLSKCIGDQNLLKYTCEISEEMGNYNVCVVGYMLMGDMESCIRVLLINDCFSEASRLCLTYAPSLLPMVFTKWQEQLNLIKEGLGNSLAEPTEKYFPNFSQMIELESIFKETRKKKPEDCDHIKDLKFVDFIEEVEKHGIQAIKSKLLPELQEPEIIEENIEISNTLEIEATIETAEETQDTAETDETANTDQSETQEIN